MQAFSREVEYGEKWSYLKHSEGVRYRAVRWYFVVAAALLTAAYTKQLQLLEQALARPVILVFLGGYSAALVRFLVDHKVAYRKHVDRIHEIDNSPRGTRDEGDGAFSGYLLTLGFSGGVVAFAAVAEVARAVCAGPNAGQTDPVSEGGVYLGIVAGLVFLWWVWGYNRCRLGADPPDNGLSRLLYRPWSR